MVSRQAMELFDQYHFDKVERIVSVDPGSRSVGVALFEKGGLVCSDEVRSSVNVLTGRMVQITERIFDLCRQHDSFIPDVIVVEFGGVIRVKQARNPSHIRVHDVGVGWLAGQLCHHYGLIPILVPDRLWKGNKEKKMVKYFAETLHNKKMGMDESHAVGLGDWFWSAYTVYLSWIKDGGKEGSKNKTKRKLKRT